MQVLKGRMKMPGFQSGGCCGLTDGLKPAGFVNRTFGTGFLHHLPLSRPINWRATVGNPFGIRVPGFQSSKNQELRTKNQEPRDPSLRSGQAKNQEPGTSNQEIPRCARDVAPIRCQLRTANCQLRTEQRSSRKSRHSFTQTPHSYICSLFAFWRM